MTTNKYDKDEAQQDLARRKNLPVVGGIYRHYHGGLYVVLAVSLNEETGEPLVTYRSNAKGTCWTRTLRNFQEHVLIQADASVPLIGTQSAETAPRFQREDT